MRKSAAHLSWEEIDEAGLRAGIAAIERRDRRKGQVVEQEPREPSGSEIRMSAEVALIERDLLTATAKRKTSVPKPDDTLSAHAPDKD